MGFTKETAKEAGKKSKRGSDKQIKAIREQFAEVLDKNQDNIQKWLDEVAMKDPAKALELLLKMSAYVIPKLRTVEAKIETDEPRVFNVNIVNRREDLE